MRKLLLLLAVIVTTASAQPLEEKLYLHTDKDCYFAGEEIWFKGYLVDGNTIKYNSPSNYIYVELYNSTDSLYLTKKVIRDDLYGFYGNITLPKDIREGDYALRGYSRLMFNNEEEIFVKRLRVDNPMKKAYYPEVSFAFEKSGRNLAATVKLLDHQKNPVPSTRIYYSFTNNGKLNTLSKNTDENGVIRVDTRYREGDYRLDLTVFGNSEYKQSFAIPALDKDYDVKLMPEGGNLITGDKNRVAFKCVGSDGLSMNVSGWLMSGVDTLQTIKSEYNGTGDFVFTPEVGKNYRVDVASDFGIKKSFELPYHISTTMGLSVEIKDNAAHLRVVGYKSGILKAVLVSEGDPKQVVEIKDAAQMPLKEIRGGISRIVLMDKANLIISERMIFVPLYNTPKIKMTPDRTRYARRDRVKMKISVDGVSDGQYSLAVTDDSSSPALSNDNIISSFLLSSDIKGNIENPADYMTDDGVASARKIELLLLTQGWSRYGASYVVTGEDPVQAYRSESFMHIEGSITNAMGRKAFEKSDVVISVPALQFAKAALTDQNGYFRFDSVDVPDSSTVVLIARKEGGSFRDLNIKIKYARERMPRATGLLNYLSEPKMLQYRTDSVIVDGESDGISYKYYDSYGIRTYVLKSITVKSFQRNWIVRMSENMKPNHVSGLPVLEEQPLDAWLMEYIQEMPGVYVNEGENGLSVKYLGREVYFIVNDRMVDSALEADIYKINLLRLNLVENISVYRSLLEAYNFREAVMDRMKRIDPAFNEDNLDLNRPVLAVYTKPDVNPYAKPVNSKLTIPVKGYNSFKEFYVPKYDVDSVKNNKVDDFRTTIYWNPKLAFDKKGNAEVEFYVSDPETTYTATIEGVNSEGIPVREQTKVVRKNK